MYRSVQAPPRPIFFIALVVFCFLLATAPRPLLNYNSCARIVVSWDFDSSAEAWARASSVEMDAEVQWKSSGTIRGTVRGPAPHLDSPGFRVFATNRHYVVMRMRSSGAGALMDGREW